ncbi:5-formyltetrahydrofolate cyclo-ligase [Albibacterium sp.]|uniref:5-formyltetrahydrofolate cyclo-ligase n=1 Tax=Albibacterium sp. TaxID=2952885 RepID=UPI002C4B80DF|nr:5-formyltetrahydrofolate cyclo-ligase [Albibacterium sp.]HUH19853.1 5-formyltetrahydrofolate cyclo-ligase [Albibacterium sp.]
MATKKELRAQFKKTRLLLTKEEEDSLNNELLRQFQQFNWSKFTYIHIFFPIKHYREPNTVLLIDWLQSAYPQIQLVLSKSDMESLAMHHYAWEKGQLLELNEWGIEEPRSGKVVLSEQLDIVLLPLLAFDRMGNRVGYGKGFYDRFLSTCRPDCLKVGLSLFEPVNSIEDTNALDVPLDYCITPNTIWEFKGF